jgi:high-affinity iron transporter
VLPTLVIGLREGLEAALIVGIIAAFLGAQGRRDVLGQVWIGVGGAVLLCLLVGIGLQVLAAELPQKQQEGLETVVGLFAVAMVTYMVVWMGRHSRGMKSSLEGEVAHALARGSARALVLMAFLAVLREGLETAVFLLALLQNSDDPATGASGAFIGIVVAAVIGYGIYRGGLKINLSRFFGITGAVLVVVAAGLVMSSAHTAHEAGWLNTGQSQALDLEWLVRPGTVLSAVFTGVLGVQPRPVVAEVIGWLAYAVPMLTFMLWPRRRARRPVPAEAR